MLHICNKLLLHNTDQSIEICNNMDEPQNNYVSKKKRYTNYVSEKQTTDKLL